MLAITVSLSRLALAYSELAAQTTNFLYAVMLTTLCTYAVAGQSSGDLTDPNHLSERPWFISKGCSAVDGKSFDACVNVTATFVCTVLLMLVSNVIVILQEIMPLTSSDSVDYTQAFLHREVVFLHSRYRGPLRSDTNVRPTHG